MKSTFAATLSLLAPLLISASPVGNTDISAVQLARRAATVNAKCHTTHVVVKDDTCWSLAQKHLAPCKLQVTYGTPDANGIAPQTWVEAPAGTTAENLAPNWKYIAWASGVVPQTSTNECPIEIGEKICICVEGLCPPSLAATV